MAPGRVSEPPLVPQQPPAGSGAEPNLEGRAAPSLLPDRSTGVGIYIEGVFDRSWLARRLGGLAGVEQVIAVLRLGGGVPVSCVYEEGGAHHYVLSLANDAFTAVRRWHFEARFDRVTLVGQIETPPGEPLPPLYDPPQCN